ncbi:MAG: acyltransferase [Pseudomonadota bacterium]
MSSYQNVMGRGKRNLELDGLRGIAVVMVLAWHFIGIPAWLSPGDFQQAVFRAFLFGGAGVNLFFILSGFLITRIALKNSAERTRFLFVFYMRRALRILPPYFLLLALFYLIIWLGVRDEIFDLTIPLWRFVTFTQNFWMDTNNSYGPDGIGVTWSVAIEEQYYLFFPLFFLLFRRYIGLVLALTALVSVVFRAYLIIADPLANAYAVDLNTFARLDGLALGGIIAFIFNDKLSEYLVQNKLIFKYLLLAMLPLLIFVDRISAVNMALFGQTYLNIFFAIVLINVMLNLGGIGFFMAILRSDCLIWFGRISYSLYLFHPLILACVLSLFKTPKGLNGVRECVLLAVAFFISLAVSKFIYKWVENPLIRFSHKFQYGGVLHD